MPQDIVSELREMAFIIDSLSGRADVKITSGHVLKEAANQIERLRHLSSINQTPTER